MWWSQSKCHKRKTYTSLKSHLYPEKSAVARSGCQRKRVHFVALSMISRDILQKSLSCLSSSVTHMSSGKNGICGLLNILLLCKNLGQRKTTLTKYVCCLLLLRIKNAFKCGQVYLKMLKCNTFSKSKVGFSLWGFTWLHLDMSQN